MRDLTDHELELQTIGNFFFHKPLNIETEQSTYIHNGRQYTVWKPKGVRFYAKREDKSYRNRYRIG